MPGAALLVAALACSVAARAQAPSATPNIDLWAAGRAYASVRLPDGSVIVGGEFTSVYDPVTGLNFDRRNLARFTPTGGLDFAWVADAGGRVDALALDASGGVIVAGPFSLLTSSVTRFGLARLDAATGVPDAAWDPVVEQGIASSLAVGPSGDVFVGGTFTAIDGVPRVGIAKLTPAGEVDPGWVVSIPGVVYAIAASSDGAVFVGGSFSSVNAQARANLARITSAGALDPTWNPAPSGGGFGIRALLLTADGLYVGGNFTAIGGQSRSNLARLAATGTGAASAWNPSPNAIVAALQAHGTSVYVGGEFTSIGGQSRSGVAKVSSAGTGIADAAWNASSVNCDASGEFSVVLYCVRTLSVAADGQQVFAGGGLLTVQSTLSLGMARLSSTGQLSPGPSLQNAATVTAVRVAPDGSIYAAGDFVRANAQFRRFLLKLAPDGQVDGTWNPDPNNLVLALDLDSTGVPVVGGTFTTIGGQNRGRLARLSTTGTGAADSWNPNPTGLFQVVNAVAGGPGRVVYVGGSFSNVGGASRQNLAKLNSSGTADATWNPSPNSNPRFLAVDPVGGGVYVGGAFQTIGGQARSELAKLSPTGTGAADAWNPAPNNSVRSMAFDGAGFVYVAGSFTTIGGQSRNYVAKLPTSGAGVADASWNALLSAGTPGGTRVETLALDQAGQLAIGGTFTQVSGQLRQRLALLSPTTGALDATWNPGANDDVLSFAQKAGGVLVVGGSFANLGGAPRRNVAAIGTLPELLSDGFE